MTQVSLTTESAPHAAFRAFNLHWARVAGVGALVSLPICYFGIVRTMFPRASMGGQLILCGVPFAVLSLLSYLLWMAGKREQAELDRALAGDHEVHWTLTGDEFAWFRNVRLKRRWRWYLYWCILPLAFGLILAAIDTFYNLQRGVSLSHCLKMGQAISLLFIGVTSTLVLLHQVFTYPMLRLLYGPDVQILFTESMIRAGDLKINVAEWNRSRDFEVVDCEGMRVLRIQFTGLRRRRGGAVVEKLVSEIPVPAGRETDISRILNTYGLNAGQGLHQSSFGFYQRAK